MEQKIKYLLTALVFLALAVYYTNTGGNILGPIGIAISGVAIAVFFLRIIFPNAKWLHVQTKPPRPFQEIYDDLGIFTYDDDGFNVQFDKKTSLYARWEEIQTITAYKMSHHYPDSFLMPVYCTPPKVFQLSKEIPGFYQFLERCNTHLPAIDKTRTQYLLNLATAPDFMLIYDRLGRSVEEWEQAITEKNEYP
ncbi:MAG: hypothetical protein JNJ57_15450 [Saprospiraceae bacterium]|nr:hypothetical protein [Saprospiraceae bacterium]